MVPWPKAARTAALSSQRLCLLKNLPYCLPCRRSVELRPQISGCRTHHADGVLLRRIPRRLSIRPEGLIAGTLPAAVTAAAATAAASGRTVLARTSFVDRQSAAFPILAIQAQDGRFGAFLGVHGGESEAARAPGVFVHNDVDFVHRAMLGQHVPEIVFGDIKGKVPDV